MKRHPSQSAPAPGISVIPFGAAKVTDGQLVVEGAEVRCSIPHVVIDQDARVPLRLNSGGLEFSEPPPLHELATVADQLDFLCAHLQRHCGVWDKRPQRFLECYFGLIARQVEDNREALAASLARFGELYDYQHWAFSALRPLPRAHLFAPLDDGVRHHDPAHMVAVDFAFWTGEAILAVDIAGTDTANAGDAAHDDRLRRAGADHITIAHDFLGPGRETEFATALPAPLRRFWAGEVLPSGPFKGPTFPD